MKQQNESYETLKNPVSKLNTNENHPPKSPTFLIFFLQLSCTFPQSPEYQTTLSCFYDTRGEAYFQLMPVKIEILHHTPELMMFHDVISDKEIEAVKTMAQPMVRVWFYLSIYFYFYYWCCSFCFFCLIVDLAYTFFLFRYTSIIDWVWCIYLFIRSFKNR